MKRTIVLALCALAATAGAPLRAQTPSPAAAATPSPTRTSAPAPGTQSTPATSSAARESAGTAASRQPARGTGARAMDRLELDTTQITGNRELPKVMVVVPWKKSDIGDLVGKPVNSLVDEALEPVDREVFRREVDYYGALAPDRPPAARSETGVTGSSGAPRAEK